MPAVFRAVSLAQFSFFLIFSHFICLGLPAMVEIDLFLGKGFF
jgi:hypothetical protein